MFYWFISFDVGGTGGIIETGIAAYGDQRPAEQGRGVKWGGQWPLGPPHSGALGLKTGQQLHKNLHRQQVAM